MFYIRAIALWFGLTLAWMGVSLAQQSVLPGYQVCSTASGSTVCSFQPVDATHGLPVSASVTVGGFQGNGNYATLTATTSSSASTALPSGGGTSVNITNTSTSATVSCTFATGAATGLVSNLVIPPQSSKSRVVGTFDHIACIDQTGSTGSNLVVLEGGSGLGNDSGGGGGSGSGGGTSSVFDVAFPANGTAIGISDGTNMKAWLAAIALGDGVNGNNTGAVASWLWNGTTYDRARGDLTNGAFVNVKTSVLPTGSATSANQTSQITKETATADALGTTADAVCPTPTGTCSLIALQKYNNNTNPVLGAGTADIGKVKPTFGAAQLSSAVISAASFGNNTLVTRAVGTIKVYGVFFSCASSVVGTLQNGTSTGVTGAMTLSTFFLPIQSEPYFTTTSTNNFVLNLGTAVQCSGTVYYLDT